MGVISVIIIENCITAKFAYWNLFFTLLHFFSFFSSSFSHFSPFPHFSFLLFFSSSFSHFPLLPFLLLSGRCHYIRMDGEFKDCETSSCILWYGLMLLWCVKSLHVLEHGFMLLWFKDEWISTFKVLINNFLSWLYNVGNPF